jgi:hypothetical protein
MKFLCIKFFSMLRFLRARNTSQYTYIPCFLTALCSSYVQGTRVSIHISGINFSENVHMYLSTAGRFAIKKYSGKNGSNGTCLTMSAFMARIKKGSSKYRRILEEFRSTVPDVTKLRVVTTFFGLANCEIPESPEIGLLLGLWNFNSLNIRIRTFAFQFFNNSVSAGARTAARYRNAGIDQRCAFCVKNGTPNPVREDFPHLFIECGAMKPVLSLYFRKAFGMEYNTNSAEFRKFKLCGLWANTPYIKKFFMVLNILLVNFVTWQFRLKKIIPGLASLENDIDTLFNAVVSGKKIEQTAMNADAYICRRWREINHRRG